MAVTRHQTASWNRRREPEDASAPPWGRWRGSRPGRFVRFAQTYLRPPRGANVGQPLKLLRWQKDFVEEYMAANVTAAVLGMGRGGGKSTFIAALAAFDLFDSDSQGAPLVPIVAASLNQARTAVYGQIVSMVQAEPELSRRTLTFSGVGTETILYPRTGGRIIPRSADPDTLQGLDIWPGGYVDEIGHIQQSTWDAVLLGRKRKGARVLGAGTWGPDTTSPLYQLRKMVREGNAPADFLWRVFTGEPGAPITDEANWRRPNPSLKAGLPAIQFLRNAVVMTPEAAFRTYHLNEPDVTGHDSWLGPDARTIWNSLEDHYQLQPDAPTFVGVDVGLVRDSTAVVCVQQRPDGRLHAVAKIWMPMPGKTVDVTAITAHLRGLAETFNVVAISFDPRLFELPAIYLLESGLPMVEVPQSIEAMTPIVGALFELIRSGGLSHEADELFGSQVVNAVPRINERGFTLSKSKSAPRGHIDACVALALACDRFAHKPKPRVTAWVG